MDNPKLLTLIITVWFCLRSCRMTCHSRHISAQFPLVSTDIVINNNQNKVFTELR